MSPRTFLIALLVSVLAFPPSIFAEDINWTNANGTGLYSDTGNWDLGSIPGSTSNATINTGADDVSLDVTSIVNSLALSGSGHSILEVNTGENSITFGTPTTLTGNVLTLSNGGVLNISSGSSAVLELSGGVFSPDAPPAPSAAIASGGRINVTDDGTLVLQNTTANTGNTIQNDGAISLIGTSGPATLQLNNGGSGAFFTLAGSGSLILDGNAQILTAPILTGQAPQAGSELTPIAPGSLVNGTGHTISGNGAILGSGAFTSQTLGGNFQLSDPGSFRNDGTLHATVGKGSVLTVDATLKNWTGSDLQGGTYIVDNGATLQLSSIGAGTSIQGLTGNAALTISGSGNLSGGIGGSTGATLGGLTNITDSSLTLNGVTGLEITPTGGTLTLSATPTGIPASLTLDSFTDSNHNTTGSNVVVHGGFTNSVDTTTTGVPNSSTLTIQNGSTLTAGAFLNQSRVGLFGDGPFHNADANVNVLGHSTLKVDSLTTSTNNGFANSNIVVTDSSLNVTHDVQQGVYVDGQGGLYSTGSDNMTFTNSAVGVGGNFSNNNGLNSSNVNVVGSTLTVTGAFSQDQAAAGSGASSLNISALDLGGGSFQSSLVTLGGLTNSGLVSNFGTSNETPQSQVSITGFSTLNILGNGTFQNIDGNGVLSGGGYFIEGGSVLKYSGADINTLDAHTFLTLDNSHDVGLAPAFLNGDGTHDALSDSLSTINGVLTLQKGATLALTQQNLSVGATGLINVTDSTLKLQNSDSGGLTTLRNDGPISINGASGTASLTLNDDGSGSTFTLTGTGTLTLANQGQIFGQFGDESLINDLNHTITGNGLIGNLNLTNNGTITATGGNLTLSAGSSGFINNGASGNMNVGYDSSLTIQTIAGGDVTLSNLGAININGGSGTVASDNTSLVFDDGGQGRTFTLSGSGSVFLNGGNSAILGANGDESLLNDTNHTIQGSGLISGLNLTNNGAISTTGGNLILDVSSAGTVSNNPGGKMNIADGATLTIRDTSGSGSTSIQNYGNINIGTQTPAAASPGVPPPTSLIFDSEGNSQQFVLTGLGAVNMTPTGNNFISGASGAESLVNDYGHTIRGGGTISNFSQFTNNGILESQSGGTLLVDTSANLTNWSPSAVNHLNGGVYVVDADSKLQLSALGSSQIQTLSGATVTLYGTGQAGHDGLLTGDGTTNAAAGISKIYSGSDQGVAALNLVNLSGTVALATDANGRFTVASNDSNVFGDGIASLGLSTTSATVGGDLVNRAKVYSDSNDAFSTVSLDTGASLTIGTPDAQHNLTNLATTNGGNAEAIASVSLTGGSTLTVNGNVINTSIDTSGSARVAGAAITADASQLFVSGTFSNTGALLFQAPGAVLSLTGHSTVTVGGLFTNDQNSLVSLDNLSSQGGVSLRPGAADAPVVTSLTTSNGFSNAGVVSLNNGSLLDNTGLFANTGALAEVDIFGGSSLVNHGAFANSDGTVNVDGLGTTLQVHGTFDNTALTSFGADLSLTGGSHATIDQQFTNDAGSFVDLDLPCSCVNGPQGAAAGGGSTLTTLNGFSNAGQVTLNLNSTLENKGIFNNTGLVTLDNGSTITNGLAPPQQPAGGSPILADFQNSGTITTGSVGGGNTINVTGFVFNTSPGVVNLDGFGDKITATGQFTNAGAVNLNGGNAKIWTGFGIDNQAGGQIALASKGNKVASALAVTNEGDIAFTGAGGKVWSGTSIDNSGSIEMTGTADFVSSEGDITNEGTIVIGAGETVRADGNYIQTSGRTTLDSGGSLTATEVELSGGVLSGFGTITGNVLVDGGTLAPGDPQAIDIIGDYTQTSGILDLDVLDLLHYDQVNITGNANLGGTLEITLDPSFDPTGINLNSIFTIMTWTGIVSGDFLPFNGLTDPTFNNGLWTFAESFNGNELDLRVVAVDTSAAPEPSTFVMLFGAMMLGGAITWGRNRRRTGRAR